jgi:beta-lactamase class A
MPDWFAQRETKFSLGVLRFASMMKFNAIILMILSVPAAAQTAHPRQSMDQTVRAAIDGFSGSVSFYAKNLDTGEVYTIRGDERVRTASTIKLPIMATIFHTIAEGHAKWDEELELRKDDKVSGSGVARELSDGVHLPIRDLVHLMIVVSDNTATNLLLERFGGDSVNAYMEQLGLKDTRSLRKIVSAGKDPSGISQAGKREENVKFGIGVTTPHEMVTILEKLERGEIVNAVASREMIAILKRQQYKDGIGRKVDFPVASKSGSLDRLRSDVGIAYSPGGRIAIAITCDNLPKTDWSADNAGTVFISQLTGILVDGLSKK